MNKKTIERIAVFALAAFLVGYFCYQVAYGTNESSYKHGYQWGSLTGPTFVKGLNENTEMGTTCTIYNANPTVTNTTACVDGFFNGWKNWCVNHAVDCVQNFTIGDFPEMIITAHQQYLAGEKAANNIGNMCPIGENAAFKSES